MTDLPKEDRDLIERLLTAPVMDAITKGQGVVFYPENLLQIIQAARSEGPARAPVVDDGMARALIEPLYSADALASRDAEIERLRGELRRAHLKRLVELSEEFGGYDELSTSALSALKTAREG